MKDVLIIAQYTTSPGTKGNGRFHYLATNFPSTHSVEIVTTNFEHMSKSLKQVTEEDKKFVPYKFTMINEPGYRKNVSLIRFYSHWRLSKELSKYLKNRKKPDIIYCAIPSLDVAFEAIKYAKKHKIPFVLDVQDLWPEAFKMVFNIPFISDLIFYPMQKKADYVYKNADALLAVSETYLNRALSVNKKCTVAESVFLGTELSYFDNIKNEYKQEKNENMFYIGYIGTLGHSYNITAIIDAISILNNQNSQKYKFIVMGDGPLREKFERYAKEKDIYCEFTGKLPYPEMVGKLCMCDIAVNPITARSAGSIINKVGDYAAAGLPVINTQECSEYRELIKKYNAGITCENDDIVGIAKAIESLSNNKQLCEQMGKGNRKFAEECFDRAKTYKKICELICNESFSNKS